MRKTLTDKGVVALKPRAKSYPYPDPQLVGHYVRVHPSGARAFVAVARNPGGKQVWHTIGPADVLKIEEAREKAREAIKRIKQGLQAVEPPPAKPDSFKAVAGSWCKRHVTEKGLRTEREIRRQLKKYVYPRWAERDFISIRRKDVADLLDAIVDDHGSSMADGVLATIRSIANWYATRDEDYVSPFVRGMRRHKKVARERILNDDELRLIWKQAEANGKFGAIIRVLLLTGQRRDKVSKMKWPDVAADGVWTIATSEREKNNAGSLTLPPQALAIIEAQPKMDGNPYIFPGRRKGPYDISQSKQPFDAKLPALPRWTVHDLRRTARSLLARAGVRPDIAERVLGHAIKGVEGVYDRHHYAEEKRDALARLAVLIDSIVAGRDNILPFAIAK